MIVGRGTFHMSRGPRVAESAWRRNSRSVALEHVLEEIQAKRASFRWWRRHPFWAAASVLAILASVGFVRRLIDWPASLASPPDVVQRAAAGQTDLIGMANVYDFWGEFIDSQHLWRVEVSPEFALRIAKECLAKELGSSRVGKKRGHSELHRQRL